MTYKISIIIPIYNSENTLKRSINSILNQKWKGNLLDDIEIILVDDCSIDSSKKIIDEYSEKYKNIISLSTNKNHGNPGTARNIGLKNSTGDYLMFLDSDDEYIGNMCETLYEIILKENADIVSCNFKDVDRYTDYKAYYHFNPENVTIKNFIVFYNEYYSTFFGDILVWNKIFKKSLIIDNNIFFPNFSEDHIFSTKCFIQSKKLIYLKDYYGVKRHIYTDSLSNSVDLESINKHMDVLFDLYDLTKNYSKNIDDYNKLKSNDLKNNIITIIAIISHFKKRDECYLILNRLYEYEKYISFDESLNNIIFDMVNYFISKKSFKIAFFIIKLLNLFVRVKFFRVIYNSIRVKFNK